LAALRARNYRYCRNSHLSSIPEGERPSAPQDNFF
jgi:hypothetical protein